MPEESLLPRWPDEEYEDAARRIGRACFGLLFEERRWVHRRVERLDVLSHELFQVSLSADLTVPEFAKDSLAIGHGQWVVPVATLPKRTLRNFNLTYGNGRAASLVEKGVNAKVAEHALRAAEWVARGSGEPGDISPGVARNLSRISSGSVEEAEDAISDLRRSRDNGDESATMLLEDPRASLLLGDLAERYLLLAVVDELGQRQLFKYSYEMPLTWWRFSPVQRLGWESLPIEAEVPGVGRTASYHAEIVVPEEIRIEGSVIFDQQTRHIYALEGESDRALLYTTDAPRNASPVLLFAVRLERPGFSLVAPAIAWVTTLLLAAGALLGDLNSAATSGAPVSVLLAGSALFAGAVARSGEHRLVRVMFFWPRVVLAANALAGLAAAAVLSLGFCGSVIDTAWDIGAVFAAVSACILSITFYGAAPARR